MNVIDTQLQKESRDRYLTYALSVVTGRALPDVRDGLKPVQRRILFTMKQYLSLDPQKSHRKSAAVVGEVLARFHPHGDTACYDAMVRMAQDFSLRYPLVDGQGNFGSLDGDNPAAYRYTEAKLLPIALEVIGEIDEETVDFRDNFDATVTEPVVLPSRVPNLLVNGATGIAVGMATSIPPHNLREVVKALLELLEDPEISNAKLAATVKGPDFPTACTILNTRKEISDMYKTGRGSVRMRGEWRIEEGSRGKRFIIVTSIPYAVNKSQLVEKIADLIVSKKIPQLSDVRDESTQEVRIVLELVGESDPEVAMAYLFKHTPLESSFPVNLTALVPVEGGSCRPELLSLKDCLQHFLNFREEVVQRKLQFEKRQLLERIHILEGLVAIYDALDEAIKIVRKSEGRADAAEKLRKRFKLSEIQSFAVVDMRIYQLSKTNIEEIRAELKDKEKRVKEIEAILKSKSRIAGIIKSELESISERFGDKRLSRLVTDAVELEFKAEDYVVVEDVYAIITADGWIKRIRQNNELGSTRLREGDSILRAHPLSTLDSVAFITNMGSLFVLKVSDFPSSSGYGDPIQKILKFKDGERIVDCFGVLADRPGQQTIPVDGAGAAAALKPHLTIAENSHIALVSKHGTGFVLKVDGLSSVKRNGKRIMKLREKDELAAVCRYEPDRHKWFMLFSAQGSGLRIKASEAPHKDSPVVGVALMGVRDNDAIVAIVAGQGKEKLLLNCESGKTRETLASEVVEGHRGLKGNKVVSRDEIKRVEVSE